MSNDLVQATKQSLNALNAQRQALEHEAAAITSELTDSSSGKPPMGIDTPLVDAEGYPRADIDLEQRGTPLDRCASARPLVDLERHRRRPLEPYSWTPPTLKWVVGSDRIPDERPESPGHLGTGNVPNRPSLASSARRARHTLPEGGLRR